MARSVYQRQPSKGLATPRMRRRVFPVARVNH